MVLNPEGDRIRRNFNSSVLLDREGRIKRANRTVEQWGLAPVTGVMGRELLDLMGINLDAFSVVGGVVIAAMGFDMLNGGAPTRAQGRSVEQEGPLVVFPVPDGVPVDLRWVVDDLGSKVESVSLRQLSLRETISVLLTEGTGQ